MVEISESLPDDRLGDNPSRQSGPAGAIGEKQSPTRFGQIITSKLLRASLAGRTVVDDKLLEF